MKVETIGALPLHQQPAASTASKSSITKLYGTDAVTFEHQELLDEKSQSGYQEFFKRRKQKKKLDEASEEVGPSGENSSSDPKS